MFAAKRNENEASANVISTSLPRSRGATIRQAAQTDRPAFARARASPKTRTAPPPRISNGRR
ncbi:MAG: hypothetical protein A2V77_06805 [Anaeromyxobacter sp. RBG_16_69_14]|nr:MAG: hypothetical protein A2V77_06805 [Anaeromyxobacter sp. RBG_16_69_14]